MVLREECLCICTQIIYREIDTLQFSSFDNEVSRFCRATAEYYRVKRTLDLFDCDIVSDFNTALELDAFFFHQFHTTEDDLLIKFHVRDTIHQKSTRTVSSLIYRDTVSRVIELVSAGKT